VVSGYSVTDIKSPVSILISRAELAVTPAADVAAAAGRHAHVHVYVIYDVRSQQMSNNIVLRDSAAALMMLGAGGLHGRLLLSAADVTVRRALYITGDS